MATTAKGSRRGRHTSLPPPRRPIKSTTRLSNASTDCELLRAVLTLRTSPARFSLIRNLHFRVFHYSARLPRHPLLMQAQSRV